MRSRAIALLPAGILAGRNVPPCVIGGGGQPILVREASPLLGQDRGSAVNRVGGDTLLRLWRKILIPAWVPPILPFIAQDTLDDELHFVERADGFAGLIVRQAPPLRRLIQP